MTTLIVSDLHLDRSHPAITAQFREFLGAQARGADALYVLGDLFEAWLGDDDPCPHKASVMDAFADLTRAGVALYFMHGNRDFLLGAGFCERTGGTLLTDPTVLQVEGRRALITHGDALCTDDVPYQQLRALVRDPRLQRRFLALGLGARAALAGEARQGSQAHTSTQLMALRDVNDEAVRATFARAHVDLIVHGHTHRPAVHTLIVEGRQCTRVVLGDWYRAGSYVRLSDEGAQLIEIPRT